MELRAYQTAGIDAARQLLRRGHKRVLLQMATGGGKTVLAAGMISAAIAKGSRVLFVAHRRELISQPYARLIEYGVPQSALGVIMANGRMVGPDGVQFDASRPGAPCQVASIQSLVRRTLPPADLVFVDEAHRACGNSYKKVLQQYVEAGARVVGLSATPVRSDGRGLATVFDAIHQIASFKELAGLGYLATPEVYRGAEPDVSEVPIASNGDYEPAALELVCDKPKFVGDVIEQHAKLSEGRSTVVFASGVQASKHLAAAFVASGVTAEHLDGTTDHVERDAILKRFRDGVTRVVVNVGCLNEGWDEVRCKCVVLARPTRSLSAYLQAAGRGLRPWQGVTPRLLDHAGSSKAHGLPQDDRPWELHPDKQRGGEAPKKMCPQCGIRVATAVRCCPNCGYEWPVPDGYEVVVGDLVKVVDPSEWPKDVKKRFYRECLITAVRKGYQKGWARHCYRYKVGSWPRWFEMEKEFYMGNPTEEQANVVD